MTDDEQKQVASIKASTKTREAMIIEKRRAYVDGLEERIVELESEVAELKNQIRILEARAND